MMVPTAEQATAARWAGVAYLFAIPPALFAEFYAFSLVDPHSAAMTASNIVTHEGLFRLGTASNLLVFAADIVLVVSLYLTLRPVRYGLAMVAAFCRLIETAVLVSALSNDLQALRLLSGAPYLAAIPPAEIQALARLALSGHGAEYNLALIFAGLGSTIFACLWWVSGFVPKWLAAFGIAASGVLAAATFSFIVFPAWHTPYAIALYGGPIFVFELVIGLWLLLRGIRVAHASVPDT